MGEVVYEFSLKDGRYADRPNNWVTQAHGKEQALAVAEERFYEIYSVRVGYEDLGFRPGDSKKFLKYIIRRASC